MRDHSPKPKKAMDKSEFFTKAKKRDELKLVLLRNKVNLVKNMSWTKQKK